MTFRLFSVDVEIQFGFWFTALMLSFPLLQRSAFPEAAIMVGVILVSVLAHEYGHAFAIRRHKIEPEIALHWMGGTTTWRMVLPLRRIDHIIISVAGPFAGFALAAIVYGFGYFAPGLYFSLPRLAQFALDQFISVNLFWGIINLLPVLPFDGGHVLEHALGPKRARLTAAISFLVGMLVAVLFLYMRSFLGAFIFGMGAIQSYQRFRSEPDVPSNAGAPRSRAARSPSQDEGAIPAPLAASLKMARQALADEQLDRSVALAEEVLAEAEKTDAPAGPRAASGAFQVIAWARFLGGRLDEAEDALRQASRLGPVDPALEGTLLMARRNLKDARRVLEGARASGDDRKEVVGPLIQVLLDQGEVARAAAIAFDVVESLSNEDARRMAEIAFEAGAFDWSARLYEAVFLRDKQAEDAYASARAFAKYGEADRALDMLRRAVEAGFSDRARAWSDAALESLRKDGSGLAGVLPRP
jgi:Zn-dependent protease